MKRYFYLFCHLLRASFIADLEYRVNIVGKIVGEFIWYVTQLLTFEVIFLHVPQLSGWTIAEARVFLGVLFLSDALYMLLFDLGLNHFQDLVVTGELDLLLAKPVNAQFMATFRRLSWPHFFNIAILLVWLWYSLSHSPHGVTVTALPLVLFLSFLGAVITYAGRFILATMSLFLVKMENLQYVWFTLQRLGNRPDVIYPWPVRLLILTILPLGFVASVPSRVVLGLSGPEWILAALALASGLLWLASFLWAKGLKSYSSASS